VTDLFPMFMKLTGKQCLVVGAGKVGEPKIAGLIDTGARIHVVAIEASDVVREWAHAGTIDLELRAFSPDDLDGKFLAVVATASESLNKFVYREAQQRGVLCNVVDVPELCDFFYPAVVRRPADRNFNRGKESIAGAETSPAAGAAVWRGVRGVGCATWRDQAPHSGQRAR
jgi:siroheme synthase (precorrin-2 oxidase/ferrochelatase)